MSAEHNPGWVGSWEAAQTVAATSGLSDTGFDDQTVRSIVHTSVGGSAIKLRISNAFGTGPRTGDRGVRRAAQPRVPPSRPAPIPR